MYACVEDMNFLAVSEIFSSSRADEDVVTECRKFEELNDNGTECVCAEEPR